MREVFREVYGKYMNGGAKLNLGCARNRLEGWTNLDFNPLVEPDVVHDLEDLPLPFPDDSFDCVFGSHVFEHVSKTAFLDLVADLHRILKPGGYLIGVTPYGTSSIAWEVPQHRMMFSEATWCYCIPEMYEGDHAGNGAGENNRFGRWEMMEQTLVPFPEFANDPEIDFKRRHWANVIQEIHCVLRAVK